MTILQLGLNVGHLTVDFMVAETTAKIFILLLLLHFNATVKILNLNQKRRNGHLLIEAARNRGA